MKYIFILLFFVLSAAGLEEKTVYEYKVAIRDVNDNKKAAALLESLQEFFEVDSSIEAGKITFDESSSTFIIQSDLDTTKRDFLRFCKKRKLRCVSFEKNVMSLK